MPAGSDLNASLYQCTIIASQKVSPSHSTPSAECPAFDAKRALCGLFGTCVTSTDRAGCMQDETRGKGHDNASDVQAVLHTYTLEPTTIAGS